MKMKKAAALFMCGMMTFGTSHMAFAESTINLDEITEGKTHEEEETRSIFDSDSTDIVTIEDGVYTVETDYAVVSIEPAFGWYCLTQDLSQQLSDFNYVFNDPSAVIESMIADGDHFLLIDPTLNILIYHDQTEDGYSRVIKNSNDMSAEDDEMIIESLIESDFTDYQSATLDAGGNHYLCFLSPDGMIAFYETVIDSVNYDFWVTSWADDDSPLTGDLISEFEASLETFTVTPKN